MCIACSPHVINHLFKNQGYLFFSDDFKREKNRCKCNSFSELVHDKFGYFIFFTRIRIANVLYCILYKMPVCIFENLNPP